MTIKKNKIKKNKLKKGWIFTGLYRWKMVGCTKDKKTDTLFSCLRQFHHFVPHETIVFCYHLSHFSASLATRTSI